MNYIIGCGGVGSAIVPSFCLLRTPDEVTLIDGDTIERKNLNRQMFDAGQIGMNKARALAGRYGCHFLPDKFRQKTFLSRHIAHFFRHDPLPGIVHLGTVYVFCPFSDPCVSE